MILTDVPQSRQEAAEGASSDYRSKLTEKIEAHEAQITELLAAAEARMEADGVKPLTDGDKATIAGLEKDIEALEGDRTRAEARAERRAKVEAAQAGNETQPGTQRVGQALVRAEPRQYDPQGPGQRSFSFLRDMYATQFPGRLMPQPGDTGDPAARMARHLREFEKDGIPLPERALGTPVPRGFFDSAAIRQTQTSDIGGPAGGLVPEQYPGIVGRHLYAGAPFLASCNRYDIPAMGMQLSIPRFSAGPGAAQHAEEGAVADSAATATNVTVPVVTAASRSRVTRALIERGDMAEEYILDMMGQALKTQIDKAIINGGGSGGAPQGFLTASRPTNHNIDQDATTKTAAKVWQTFGLGIDKVSQARYMRPDAMFVHQRRLSYMYFALDSTSRPLFQANLQTGFNVFGIGRAAPTDAQMPEVAADLAGIPLIVDNNIPLVQDSNQDSAMVMRRADQHCWGQSMPFMLTWEQTAGTTLEVDLVGYEYYGFSSEVQPEGGCNVKGSLFSTVLSVSTS